MGLQGLAAAVAAVAWHDHRRGRCAGLVACGPGPSAAEMALTTACVGAWGCGRACHHWHLGAR
eukprot:1567286-Heterocapsa_arctica.AAC.1